MVLVVGVCRVLGGCGMTGGDVRQSVFHRPVSFAVGGLVLGLVLSIFRNDFGALLRALGLMLILMLQRYKEGESGEREPTATLLPS